MVQTEHPRTTGGPSSSAARPEIRRLPSARSSQPSRSTQPSGAVRRTSLARSLVTACALVAALTGCSGGFPADPDGTLETVTGGVLRVGVSSNPPWTETGEGAPTGLEPELVEGFAESVDAEVEWTSGGEEDLVGRLERSELDLVVGGFTEASPWSAQAALTYPYTTVPGPDGAPEAHVMAAPMGENAFLVALETYLLDRQDVQP